MKCFFFFSSRRRHTRWNCDWSSDVCSSDLLWQYRSDGIMARAGTQAKHRLQQEIGRASCRERVEISGVAVSLKKKKKKTSRFPIETTRRRHFTDTHDNGLRHR